tara:strand:- start:573 stop:1451 length:879 start_codon:yes stop_codon:yes gene_type:complete
MSDNLYNPSGGGGASVITEIEAGNHKVFYSNGSGTIVELALPADGTVLVGNGTSSAPTFGNLVDIKGGNDKVLYTNSSGAITELAIGATGTGLKSNGTTSAPSFASLGGNWSTIGSGTYSTGTNVMFNLTSLSNYRAVRGWFTWASANTTYNTAWGSMRINGKTSTDYYYAKQYLSSDTLAGSAISNWGGIFGSSSTYYYGYVDFDLYALAEGEDTTNRLVITGTTRHWSRFTGSNDHATTGQFDETWMVYDEPLTSDTGITEVTAFFYNGTDHIDVASGYNAYYVEGYTAS